MVKLVNDDVTIDDATTILWLATSNVPNGNGIEFASLSTTERNAIALRQVEYYEPYGGCALINASESNNIALSLLLEHCHYCTHLGQRRSSYPTCSLTFYRSSFRKSECSIWIPFASSNNSYYASCRAQSDWSKDVHVHRWSPKEMEWWTFQPSLCHKIDAPGVWEQCSNPCWTQGFEKDWVISEKRKSPRQSNNGVNRTTERGRKSWRRETIAISRIRRKDRIRAPWICHRKA